MLSSQRIQSPTSDRELFVRDLPTYVIFLAVLLTLSFLVMITSAFTGVQLGSTLSHPNPFTPYETIWPGQTAAALFEYAQGSGTGFVNCFSGERYAIGSFGSWAKDRYQCMNTLGDSVFRSVQVDVAQNRIHDMLLFSDVLPEDTLMLYWGIPDSIAQSGNPQWLKLYWERSTYSADALVNKADSIVKLITLTVKE